MAGFAGFSQKSFDLLARYKKENAGSNYDRNEFGPLVREPFQQIAEALFPFLQERLPNHELSDLRVLSGHATRANLLYHHFWGAFYRTKQEKKSNDVQLFFYIEPAQFKFGVYMGYGIDSNLREKVFQQIATHNVRLQTLLGLVKFIKPLRISVDDANGFIIKEIPPVEVTADNPAIKANGVNFYFSFTPEEATKAGSEFLSTIKEGFAQLTQIYDFLIENDSTPVSLKDPLNETAKATAASEINYWLLAPGEGAHLWEEFQEDGIGAVGWDWLLGDLSKYPDRAAIDLALVKIKSDSETDPRNTARALHDFSRVMKPGDIVFAKKGRTTILGYGKVKSDYRFDKTRSTYKHVRDIEWLKIGERTVAEDDRFGVKALTNVTPYPQFVQNLIDLCNAGVTKLSRDAKPVIASPYSRDEALKDLFISDDLFDTICESLQTKKNIILQGPPGVGKTFIAKRLAYSIIGAKAEEQVEMVQFHQSYSYEDFVQGFRPTDSGGFELRNGSFLTIL